MTPTALEVLLDARLAIRGLGIATVVERLVKALTAAAAVDVAVWRGTGEWGRRGVLSTLARSGPFDVSPRLDPRTRRFRAVHYICNVASLFPGRSSVVTVHDLLYRRHLQPQDRLIGFLLEGALRRAGRVVAGSGQTADDLHTTFPWLVGRVEVIPNGMRRLPRPAGERVHVLGFGGGGDPRKRVDLMIDAYAAYRTRHADPLPLVVLARAGLTAAQRARLAVLEARVVESATRQEVDAFLAAAAALVYPSTEEGFGLPILEAAEWGTPVVMDGAARVAREVVGRHCTLVADPDAARWGDALDRAIASAPVHDALELPGWDEVAARYAALYREVADAGA